MSLRLGAKLPPAVKREEILVGEDVSHSARLAAQCFSLECRQAIAGRGRALVALSGGSTPKALFGELVKMGDEAPPLSKLELFWSDERFVPHSDARSNFGLAWRSWLEGRAEPASLHAVPTERESAEAAASAYQGEIARVAGVSPLGAPPPFDLILLGLGEDGHTASLFPGNRIPESSTAWVGAFRHPQQGDWRVSFLPSLIQRARVVMILAWGESKRAILGRVFQSSGAAARLPIQWARRVQGRVIWVLDAAAASGLHEPRPRDESAARMSSRK